MQHPHLFDLIRDEFGRLLNRYVRNDEVIDHLDRYIQAPMLGGRAGVLGCLVLAEQALEGSMADGSLAADATGSRIA